MLIDFRSKRPQLEGDNYFIAENASVVGDVTLANNISIWYGAVVRADDGAISIGNNSNVQDNCVLHVDIGYDLVLGCNVTIGHAAVVHGCTIENNCIIGIHSTILNGAKIGKNCIVEANALVTQNKIIPNGSLVLGSPGKVVRTLTADEINTIQKSAEYYVDMITDYK
ncbi:MAG: gamma carbonic anhydrase family protein [Gammaproteobacteria bacterium]|nr:gamma carbonic anhydrase family protein [Gammaproteobacteria bacterium]